MVALRVHLEQMQNMAVVVGQEGSSPPVIHQGKMVGLHCLVAQAEVVVGVMQPLNKQGVPVALLVYGLRAEEAGVQQELQEEGLVERVQMVTVSNRVREVVEAAAKPQTPVEQGAVVETLMRARA